METASEAEWDVVISGTGLQQSLLALALSRSNKKLLHVDPNEYYGGTEAAFSLQEVEEWVAKVQSATESGSFSNATIWRESDETDPSDAEKLSFSRAYTLALASQIIYSRSKLLSQLVSSKVYRQLEFQAVGSWWIYDAEADATSQDPSDTSRLGHLRRLPNGREDVFADSSIDVRSKRNLMKFLKFVVDYEDHEEDWKQHAEESLPHFLSANFNLPPYLQQLLFALTLSLDDPERTSVRYALPRISRHLTSIGLFGPGFGAVIPKWGGLSEISQVACRAGAVGGGVYMLGTGVKSPEPLGDTHVTLSFTNDEAIRSLAQDGIVRAKKFVTDTTQQIAPEGRRHVSKMTAIVSSGLEGLFTPTVEGSPTAAVSVIAIPPGSLTRDDGVVAQPIYIMAHSSDTGECPQNQCVLYASMATTPTAQSQLKLALERLLSSFMGSPKVLFSLYYEQAFSTSSNVHAGNVCHLASPSMDLAFDDACLDNVEDAWRTVMCASAGDETSQAYLQYEDRGGHLGEDDA